MKFIYWFIFIVIYEKLSMLQNGDNFVKRSNSCQLQATILTFTETGRRILEYTR
jgi:hypothetical protein